MTFHTRLKVRFGDVDRAGIAYYPRIFDAFHVAFEEFWERFVGVPYARVVTEEHCGFPTVRAEAHFRRPLRFGDDLDVAVFLSRVGETSAVFEYRIGTGTEDGPAVEASLLTVCVDLRTFTKQAIPARYRARLEACLEASPRGARGSE
jgi:YbgC/YbaW family acyl-CoA thioester hydrolase